jgi:multicomponent Na+:H+ antiporter subunit D
LAIVLPPLLGALLVTAIALRTPALARALVIGSSAVSLIAAAIAAVRCSGGGVLEYSFGGWAAPYGIVYRIDGLSALMSLLISAIGFLVLVYSGRSIGKEIPGHESSFLATAALLLAALLGMVVTGDLFNLYVFLEIASITAYSLIASGGGAASLASFRYLLVGTLGATFYLLGLAYLFALTGTLNMVDMAARLPTVSDASAAVLLALGFIVTGFALKAALFPMHAWLPDAYTYAPSTATALIAALMTKVSAFALLRVLYGVLWPTLAPLQLPLSVLLGWPAALGIIAGSVMALAQTDLKRLLAYSSIGHIGYVLLGLALGSRDGMIGAMLHIVAHAITKGCLFLIADAVAYRTGKTDLTSLQAASRQMPVAMAALVVCALSMIGIPPTAGFFGKWYLLIASIEAGHLEFVAVLLLSTLLNAWYFFRLLERIYFAPAVSPHFVAERTDRAELPRAMLAPILTLAAAIIVAGVVSRPLVQHLLADPVARLHTHRVTPVVSPLPVAR